VEDHLIEMVEVSTGNLPADDKVALIDDFLDYCDEMFVHLHADDDSLFEIFVSYAEKEIKCVFDAMQEQRVIADLSEANRTIFRTVLTSWIAGLNQEDSPIEYGDRGDTFYFFVERHLAKLYAEKHPERESDLKSLTLRLPSEDWECSYWNVAYGWALSYESEYSEHDSNESDDTESEEERFGGNGDLPVEPLLESEFADIYGSGNMFSHFDKKKTPIDKVKKVGSRHMISLPSEGNLCGFYSLLVFFKPFTTFDEDGAELDVEQQIWTLQEYYKSNPHYNQAEGGMSSEFLLSVWDKLKIPHMHLSDYNA